FVVPLNPQLYFAIWAVLGFYIGALTGLVMFSVNSRMKAKRFIALALTLTVAMCLLLIFLPEIVPHLLDAFN
ncbi:hypothetical protein JXJ21_21430, partial [candidate division KSB1 bacterium]|nr:hypothetical protein [candidate division KSB1 bacterium]